MTLVTAAATEMLFVIPSTAAWLFFVLMPLVLMLGHGRRQQYPPTMVMTWRPILTTRKWSTMTANGRTLMTAGRPCVPIKSAGVAPVEAQAPLRVSKLMLSDGKRGWGASDKEFCRAR